MYIDRIIPLEKELLKKSILLLGPRRTGKSSFMDHQIKADKTFNLLEADLFIKLSKNPALIRQTIESEDKLIAIDEIQKMPLLMDEVHLMIEKFKVKFLLSGSSARKLKRTHTGLMAGRAKSFQLFPFVSAELPKFNLNNVLKYGLLPPVYFSKEPWDELKNYVSDYLKEEILAEALSRNISNFSRFLNASALANTEILNFESVGNDSQVSAKTVRDYYQVLEDTLIGRMIEPFKVKSKRKMVMKGKFYFFDIGVVNAISDQKTIPENSVIFGKNFEHFIFLELFAYSYYFKDKLPITFWKTHSGFEVDFIVGDELAIEVKSSKMVCDKHLSGLKAIENDHKFSRRIVVSRDSLKRKIGKIEIYPYQEFLKELWSHKLF